MSTRGASPGPHAPGAGRLAWLSVCRGDRPWSGLLAGFASFAVGPRCLPGGRAPGPHAPGAGRLAWLSVRSGERPWSGWLLASPGGGGGNDDVVMTGVLE